MAIIENKNNTFLKMKIAELFADKNLKPKAKTEMLCKMLVEKSISIDELIAFAQTAKDPIKATCIESLEFATKQNPSFGNEKCWQFAIENLTAKSPRIKWESAKVVGNIAHLFSKKLDKAITNLLINAQHEGTVVRWSAAFALGEIVKLKSKHNADLIRAIENICHHEEKNSIKKIYQAALK